MKRSTVYLTMLLILIGVFLWSSIAPLNRAIWFYESTPGILLLLILVLTYRRFPLTPLAYLVVFIGVIVLFVGAHYTFGGVPLFHQLKSWLHLTRNHYDRVGHFFQGAVSCILLREYFARTKVIQRTSWLTIMVVGLSLALSAAYEIFELMAAKMLSNNIQEFLGTQGDLWDSHWDMLSAFLGAIIMAILGKLHDRQIEYYRRRKK